MFNLNKIHAHIKRQKFHELKLSRYRDEENRKEKPDAIRLADIDRALNRVTENIKMWESKLTALENSPPRPADRPSVIDGPDRPLIG